MGYHGNPQEFLAKMENLKIAIKKSGIEEITIDEIVKFFKKYKSFQELVKDVPKLEHNYFFEAIYRILVYTGPASAQQEIKRVIAAYL